jgi:type IV pilus assembly protein PilO
MPDLRDTKGKIKIGLIAMACVDIVAVGLLWSPLIGSAASRRAQMDQLNRELQEKTRQVAPLREIDKKVIVAAQQINTLYKERLPAFDSEISDRIGKLAQQSGIRILQAKYKTEDTESVGLAPVLVEAELSGDYLQLVRFVNSVERDKMFFILNSVALGGEQNGPVKLEMKLETYLKTGATE